MRPLAWLFVACALATACGRAEDPRRAELRARLKQEQPLSAEELGRVREEVGRTIAGKKFVIKEDGAVQDLDDERRTAAFGMLTYAAGMFDEGLRMRQGRTYRVLNAPGESLNLEIEATRRLWIDVDSLLPGRFEFAYAAPSPNDYSFDLDVAR
jgi:hypothetical protein